MYSICLQSYKEPPLVGQRGIFPVTSLRHLSSERGSRRTRKKIPAMDSTKAYSHCWDFLLAEIDIRVITIKLIEVLEGVRLPRMLSIAILLEDVLYVNEHWEVLELYLTELCLAVDSLSYATSNNE